MDGISQVAGEEDKGRGAHNLSVQISLCPGNDGGGRSGVVGLVVVCACWEDWSGMRDFIHRPGVGARL